MHIFIYIYTHICTSPVAFAICPWEPHCVSPFRPADGTQQWHPPMAPSSGTQQWHHVHSAKVGDHPPTPPIGSKNPIQFLLSGEKAGPFFHPSSFLTPKTSKNIPFLRQGTALGPSPNQSHVRNLDTFIGFDQHKTTWTLGFLVHVQHGLAKETTQDNKRKM